jgi:endonuclease G
VAVPEAFFMIVIDETAGRVRAQAFMFPQTASPEARLEDHVVSIDAIEQRTGLDFLSALPDEAEAALESMQVSRVW